MNCATGAAPTRLITASVQWRSERSRQPLDRWEVRNDVAVASAPLRLSALDLEAFLMELRLGALVTDADAA
jgi:hypothetical protein